MASIIDHENYDKINQMKMNVDFLEKKNNREQLLKKTISM